MKTITKLVVSPSLVVPDQEIKQEIPVEIIERVCKKCNIKKFLVDFPTSGPKKNGKIYHTHTCKECGMKSLFEWQKNNPEKVKEKKRKYAKLVSSPRFLAKQRKERLRNGAKLCIGGCGKIIDNRSICPKCVKSDQLRGLS